MDTVKPSYPTTPDGRRPVTLALEGGGALGAFTWGVLDRLLEVPDLRIDVVSGSSAGAMNGAMLVQGLASGGPDRAKRLLETFWQRVAIAAGSLPGSSGLWMQALTGSITGSLVPMLTAVRSFSPALNPGTSVFGINLLRAVLAELLHPPLFGQAGAPELVVAATRVRTGEAHLFRGADVSIDALLASACLPQLFPAIEIDGEAYWDGGYSSNPPIRPLIEAGAPADILVVRTLPASRPDLPHGVTAVKDRVNEITFGTPLRAELRTLALAQASLAGMADLPPTLARLRDARLHMITPADDDVDAAPITLPSWSLLADLRARGAAAAERWIATDLAAVGQRSSVDLNLFAGAVAPTPINHHRKEPAHAT